MVVGSEERRQGSVVGTTEMIKDPEGILEIGKRQSQEDS